MMETPVALRQYADARDAIRIACAQAPAVVGWKSEGWVVYDATGGAPVGVQPEMMVYRIGCLPVPLSETGALVLRSALGA